MRIVCMTEETTETLYRLGCADTIVGISTFTQRPAKARQEKPIVSQFTKANLKAILDLEPDLVLGFSDLQADVCAELIREGVSVYCSNQRSVEEILNEIRRLGALVGATERAAQLVNELRQGLSAIREAAEAFPKRPRVYFEEWHDPMITGIRWVSELIEIAGGDDCFAKFRDSKLAKDRIVEDPEEVIRRNPDVYLASWCGRKFRPDYLPKRKGWSGAAFLEQGHVHEIDAATILQPGPAALSDGVWAIHSILAEFVKRPPAPAPVPLEALIDSAP